MKRPSLEGLRLESSLIWGLLKLCSPCSSLKCTEWCETRPAAGNHKRKNCFSACGRLAPTRATCQPTPWLSACCEEPPRLVPKGGISACGMDRSAFREAEGDGREEEGELHAGRGVERGCSIVLLEIWWAVLGGFHCPQGRLCKYAETTVEHQKRTACSSENTLLKPVHCTNQWSAYKRDGNISWVKITWGKRENEQVHLSWQGHSTEHLQAQSLQTLLLSWLTPGSVKQGSLTLTTQLQSYPGSFSSISSKPNSSC